MAAQGDHFTRRSPPPTDKFEVMAPWFERLYLVYLRRMGQGGTVGPLCACTLGIDEDAFTQLEPGQKAQIADMFRSAEGEWAEDGPQQGFDAPQTGGGGRPVFPILLKETPHSGDRLIKPFARGDTRGTFCLSTDGTQRLVAVPNESAQFYPNHTADDKEMWPSLLVFDKIKKAH
ncbi:uncharacterized protein LOC144660789 [Oculina patagonica]